METKFMKPNIALLAVLALGTNCGYRQMSGTIPGPASKDPHGLPLEQTDGVRIQSDGADGSEDPPVEAKNDADQNGGDGKSGGSGSDSPEGDSGSGSGGTVENPPPVVQEDGGSKPPPIEPDDGITDPPRPTLDDNGGSNKIGGCRALALTWLEGSYSCQRGPQNRHCVMNGKLFRGEPLSANIPENSYRIRTTLSETVAYVTYEAIQLDFADRETPLGGIVPKTEFALSELTPIAGDDFEVPFADAIAKNEFPARQGVARIIAKAHDDQGKILPSKCDVDILIDSPLVFSFSKSQQLDTLPLNSAGPKFDFRDIGQKFTTGWIKPEDAFLVMDQNSDGQINNDFELFGERSFGGSYANGYEALKTIDHNGDGMITEADPQFQNLQLWFDRNTNAKVDDGELQPLRAKGITKIATSYEATGQRRHLLQNYVPYRSKFWGPQNCGKSGCRTFDVFFATMPSGSPAMVETGSMGEIPQLFSGRRSPGLLMAPGAYGFQLGLSRALQFSPFGSWFFSSQQTKDP